MKQYMIETYKDAIYPLRYHGSRDIQILKDSLLTIEGSVQSDIYGNGPVINDFEDKMAQLLGKPSAVFFPSGTMAQQIALRIWCDRNETKTVGYHPLCHLEIHEEGGLKELHHIRGHFLCHKEALPTLEDIQRLPKNVKVILLELPQREIGGQLPSFETLRNISDHCRAEGIKLHLDGARLLETLPYYNKTAEALCNLFDSVYMSFYKGINGIAGAILAGDVDLTTESKVWKRRHGGDLISLYPYVISADYHYELRKERFVDYYEAARLLAYQLNLCKGIHTVPKVPVSNMFHVYFHQAPEAVVSMMNKATEATDVSLTPMVMRSDDGDTMFEMSVGDLLLQLPDEKLNDYIAVLKRLMEED